MPRTARSIAAGGLYHVLNRGNARSDIFHKPEDHRAFLRVLAEGLERYPVELLGYCLMSNHWHLMLRPRTGPALGRFVGWVGVTHVRRHHEHYQTRGGGHLYQGRFKSFPVKDDAHLLTVCRYIEANPLRAGMVGRAEDWEFSSLRYWPAAVRIRNGTGGETQPLSVSPLPLTEWPIHRPKDWLERVNEPLAERQLENLRTSVNRGRPFGDEKWVKLTARRLRLEHTLRSPGRPKKREA